MIPGWASPAFPGRAARGVLLMGSLWAVLQWAGAGTSLAAAVLYGLLYGAVIGTVKGMITARAIQAVLVQNGLTDRSDQRAAARAAEGGPVPQDLAVRAAATELARRLSIRYPAPALRVLGGVALVALLASGFLAFAVSLRFWAVAAWIVAVVWLGRAERETAARRWHELEGSPDAAAGRGAESGPWPEDS